MKNSKAVKHADRFVTVNGKKHAKKTTEGWDPCVEWKDGATTWEQLADIEESHPIEAAEHAASQGIDHEPAFAHWAPHVLKKRNGIIAAVNKRHHKVSHKFGFKIPKTIKEAQQIDKDNGNALWQDAIDEEMGAAPVAFEMLNDGEEPPPGHQFMRCHLVFDVELEGNFRRKARLVAGGHMTETPVVVTCASVVLQEMVWIALTMAALNDLEAKTSDIQCAFLTAPCEEKIFTMLGPEFGPDAGKKAIIV